MPTCYRANTFNLKNNRRDWIYLLYQMEKKFLAIVLKYMRK